MKKSLVILLISVFAVCGLFAQTSLKGDTEAKSVSDTYLSAFLKGIDKNDNSSFLMYCTEDFKTRMSAATVTALKNNLDQAGKIKSRVYLGYTDKVINKTYSATIIWKAYYDKANVFILLMLIRVDDKLLIDGIQIG
jgi:hypothetical protein